MNKIKKELKIIRNLWDNDLSIRMLKKSLIYYPEDAIPQFEEPEERHSQYDPKTLDIKVKVNSNKLKEDLLKKPKEWSMDYILNNYIEFEYSKEAKEFMKKLNISFGLKRNGYIKTGNIWIVNCWTFNITRSEYNEFSDLKPDKYGSVFWRKKDSLECEIKKNLTGFLLLKENFFLSDDIARELLFKGQHTIRIKYCTIVTELTEKGENKLNERFWKDAHFQWIFALILPLSGVSIFEIIKLWLGK